MGKISERELEIIKQYGHDGFTMITDQLSKVNINPVMQLAKFFETGMKILPYMKPKRSSFIPNKYTLLAAYYTLIECRYDKAMFCINDYLKMNQGAFPMGNDAMTRFRAYLDNPGVMYINGGDDE